MLSWGKYPKIKSRQLSVSWPTLQNLDAPTFLPTGNHRSYGDSCLSHSLDINFNNCDRFLSFDAQKGVFKCQAGVLLHDILNVIVPHGWFLPVTPGTKFVTVAGAVANDVHGKNHHVDGCFGNHVLSFELLRSDGSIQVCTPEKNSELFNATIGGLGLTGIITWVEFQLKRISSPLIETESIKFKNLDDYFSISQESDDFMYTVSWVDCLAKGDSLGRGAFMRGVHSEQPSKNTQVSKPKLNIPFHFPNFALNGLSMWAFNQLYYNKQMKRTVSSTTHYSPFFYPLDAIDNWNRIYGQRGFLQYQFVIPFEAGREVIRDVFKRISKSNMGSFLAVLKNFGNIPSPGLLSFPKEGVTLALDFPNHGPRLFKLLNELDEIVVQHQGRIYPAKDARMSAETFKKSFPNWQDFIKYKDPKISSAFWERVIGE